MRIGAGKCRGGSFDNLMTQFKCLAVPPPFPAPGLVGGVGYVVGWSPFLPFCAFCARRLAGGPWRSVLLIGLGLLRSADNPAEEEERERERVFLKACLLGRTSGVCVFVRERECVCASACARVYECVRCGSS